MRGEVEGQKCSVSYGGRPGDLHWAGMTRKGAQAGRSCLRPCLVLSTREVDGILRALHTAAIRFWLCSRPEASRNGGCRPRRSRRRNGHESNRHVEFEPEANGLV